jgi:hypothetical protein
MATKDSSQHAQRARHVLTEAYGQAGVRQHLGAVVSWVSLILMFVAIGMLARSHFVVDRAFKTQGVNQTVLQSAIGQILLARIELDPYAPAALVADGRWNVGSFPIQGRIPDRWPDGWAKTLGVEFSHEPLRFRNAVGGSWLRVKWSTLAFACAVIPVTRIVVQRLRWLRDLRARAAATPAGPLQSGPPLGSPG